MTIQFKVYRSCFLILIAANLAGHLSTEIRADDPIESTKPVHIRVTWTNAPANNATISWSSTAEATSHVVRFRAKGSEGKETTVKAEKGKYADTKTDLTYYHARLSKLEPMTAYEIQIQNDDHVSPKTYFVTAPGNDRPFSIFSGGDSRTNKQERRRANQMLSRMTEQSYANSDLQDDIIALAHGGDFVATGTNLTQWIEWLSAHELTTCSDGRMLPIIPTRGNHDKGKIFNQVMGFTEDDKNYYALNLSPKVRLITLNTEIATAGAQAKWLGNELKVSRPLNRWVMAQYHRPAYPAVKTPGTALQSWVPTFEKHNVDLVCELDGHAIKRTLPIRGNVHDKTGVVYIGEGGLGVAQRAPKQNRWYIQSPGYSASSTHVYVLTFKKDWLLGKCVRIDGTIADQFVLLARKIKPKKVTPPKKTTNTKPGSESKKPMDAKTKAQPKK
ncbi:MAG: metallophosphoesterase family protein [Mariniblastus sp.]|nr:metallophosphoesterase family protein [Mariniblastus sp.]